MGNFVNLRFNGVINFPAAVSVNIYPQAGNTVIIAAPFGIVQFYAVAAFQ
mgnify:CR=1 FL=1